MLRNQKGQGMVEYILIVALVVVGAVGLWLKFGNHVTDMLDNSNTSLEKALNEQKNDQTK